MARIKEGIIDLDSDGVENNKDGVQAIQQRSRDALFRVFHDLAEDTSISFAFLVLLWALDLANLLLLPLGPSAALPWGPSAAMHGFWSFFSYLWFVPAAGEHFTTLSYSWSTLYAVIASWMCISLAILCFLTWANAGFSEYKPRWMILVLRVSARVAIHGLWGTIVMNLLDPFTCSGSTWRETGIGCWGGGHVALCAFSAVLLLLALLLHIVVALTFINREADFTGKRNLLAAPHGRVDASMLLLKTAMSFLFVFGTGSGAPAALLVPSLAAGLAWGYVYLRYQPYHNGYLNGAQVAMAAVYVSACVCALLAAGLGASIGGGEIGSVAFLFSLPIVIFTGWALYLFYSRQFITGKSVRGSYEMELSTPYAVELRARALLAESISAGVDPRAVPQVKGAATEDYYGSSSQQMLGIAGRRSSNSHDHAVLAARGTERASLLSDQGHADSQAHAVLQAKAANEKLLELWKDAARSFGNNTMLYLFWANFHSTVNLNFHLERLMLREAVVRADWSHLDVHFFAWSRNLTLAMKADAEGATKMNVERRMRYEKLVIQSRYAVTVVREQVLAFWSELSGKHPDLIKLQAFGESINDGMRSTDLVFKELLELAPQNASVIRSYAEFLLELSNDPRKAEDLLADAEQLEDDVSKAHGAGSREHSFALTVQDFDLSADSVGTLRVASDRENLGTVLACNLAACRLTGYSQRELVGRSLSDLIPQPIGAAHDDIMRRFVQMGETRFLGSSRLTFFLHRGGYMVPSRVFVQPTGSDFHAVLDTAQTPAGESYLWCFGPQSDWQVTAVCENAMAMLQIDPNMMRSGSVALSSYIGDVQRVIDGATAKGMARAVITQNANNASTASIAKQAEHSSIKVTVKCQPVAIAAVGQTIYMLRFKRDVGTDTMAEARMSGLKAFEGVQDGRESESGSSDGSSGADSNDSRDNLRGTPPPGRAGPNAHYGQKHGEGDISACPVMGGGSRRGAAVPAVRLVSAMAGSASRGVTGLPGTVPSFSTMRRASVQAQQPKPQADEDFTTDLTAAVGNARGKLVGLAAEGAIADGHGVASRSAGGLEDDHTEQDPTRSSTAQSRPSTVSDSTPPAVGAVAPAKKRFALRLPSGHQDSFLADSDDDADSPVEAARPAVSSSQKLASDGLAVRQRRSSLPPPMGHSPMATKSTHAVEDPRLPEAVHVQARELEESASVTGLGHATAKSALKAGRSVPLAEDTVAQHDNDRFKEVEVAVASRAGSVHSKGSGVSKGSATSITEVVRRGVLSRSGKLESSLRTLRWAVIFTFLITAGLNLASLLATTRLVSQMRLNLDLVEKNGRRAILAQRLYSNVQTYRASALGLAHPIDMEYERSRDDIYLKEYTALNELLYLSVDGSLLAETDLYTNGSALTLLDFKNGTIGLESFDFYQTTQRTSNLANAAAELATRTRSVLAMNASDILFVEPTGNVYWIVANGPASLRTAMNESLMLADQRSATQGDTIKLSDFIILIMSEVIFLLVIGLIIVPSVFKVAASRQAVFDTFIQVPLPIVLALRSSVQKRIESIQRAETEADVGIDVAGAGNEVEREEEDGGDLKQLLKAQRTSFASPSNSRTNTDDDTGLSAAVNASANTGSTFTRGKKPVRRSFKRAGSARYSTLLNFTWPVVAYMLYFIIMWWYKGTIVEVAAKDRSQMLWSTQVELYVRLANIRLRWAYTFCDPVYMTQQLDLAESNLAFTSVLVDQLLYGAAERNLPAGLQEGVVDFNELWLHDACSRTEGSAWYYDYEVCQTFSSGLVARGLLGSVASYADIGRKLIADRRTLIGSPRCTAEHVETAGTPKALMNDLGVKYLASGFSRSTKYQYETAKTHLAGFASSYTAIVAVTISFLVLLWLVVYSPQIRRLDKDIKSVRLLLLLFPDEVARSVPAIVNAGRALLAEAGSSAGSAAGSVVRH